MTDTSGAEFPVDTHDRNSERPYTTSLQQRQQQAADYYRAHHNHSRVSSSSGSHTTLRRTPNFEDLPRAQSVPSVPTASPDPEPQSRVRFAPTPIALSHAHDPPHPALRISRRTASAIHWVLEEALRVPVSFTPVLEEENANMSDLSGSGTARAANGGARVTAAPVPVTQSDRSNIRTPQMIMNTRREREAARRQQAEQDAARAADDQRKAEEERRRNVERRVHAAGVVPIPSDNAAPRQAAQNPPLRSGDAASSGGPVNPPVPGQSQDTSSGAQYGRPRASSQAAQQQTRLAPAYQSPSATATAGERPSAAAGSAQAGSAQAGPSTTVPPPPGGSASGSQPRQSTTSTFPHAFERWETLSSHWEGLTSYWIRRLEQNSEEVRREPLAQQMSRQITDLSAAGANLFHAVVELQRLRASSERKFQRWFYEHRQEQERSQEKEAQLEHTLRVEREARADAVQDLDRMTREKNNAERMVMEMRRELQISKEEARRAWEELGRREQEEREKTFSLREGQPTVVGGVQVVPMSQSGVGRHPGAPQRTQGGDETYGIGSGQDIEQHYTYDEGHSPTDTDPFAGGRGATPLRHEPEHPSLAQGAYVPTGASVTPRAAAVSSAASYGQLPATAPAPAQQRTSNAQSPAVPTTSRPEAFYQQPEAYLHRDTATTIPEDERSYTVTSHGEETSEGEEEYAIDESGNFILDEAGHRVPYRSLRQRDSDEYDVQEDRRRELEHLQRYGTAPQSMSGYTATTSAGSGYNQGYTTANAPDYSGSDYPDEWAQVRHHHPTRLSDVLEEDERSRTSPSRASQASRGFY
ncbi:hypothetical protein B0J11DRAFT_549597 [Dendryphion nanum]|uniref:Uncharacterized protein n=1 Tax=Dendryphion nanum TaxID=256645 RepID=A0A9P9DWJ4_9PLEO|nr:hypothetical protein B0J11DRAFT_549597 [Dendryphion nanum]